MVDIVERLRMPMSLNDSFRAMEEAAREIERLRGVAQAERQPLAIENDQLRKTIQLHAGDAMSLSGELDEWRERALAAEEALANSPAQAPMDREKVAKIFAYIWHGDLGEWQGFLSKADAFLTYPVPSTDRGYPDPQDRWEGWPDPPLSSTNSGDAT